MRPGPTSQGTSREPRRYRTAGRLSTFPYDGADWLTEQLDGGPNPSSQTDDRKILTTHLPTGWESRREVLRWVPGSFTEKQQTDWTWSANGLLTDLDTRNGSGTILETHDLTYITGGIYLNGHRATDAFMLKGPSGQPQCRTATCTTTFTYDGRDRLKTVQDARSTTKTTTYTLDLHGNVTRIAKTGVSNDTVMDYEGDQLVRVTVGSAVEEHFYDAFGNLDCVSNKEVTQTACTAIAQADLKADYAFDSFDRLSSYDAYAGGTLTDSTDYVYDALDRVVEQTETHSGTTKTRLFTHPGLTDLITTETVKQGSTTETEKSFGYDAYGHRISMTDDPGGPGGGGVPEQFLYAYDVHGSASLLVNDGGGSDGQARSSYGYSAYGDADTDLTAGDPADTDVFNPFRYAGDRYDTGSGTYDTGARRFSSSTAHFLSRDLFLGSLSDLGLGLDPLTQNRYALAAGNPVSFVEWDGHTPLRDNEGGAATLPAPVGGTSEPSLGCSITKLNCTMQDFNDMTAGERLLWLNRFQERFAGYNVRGWFNIVEDVIRFGGERNLIERSKWFSWIDARILSSIQSGFAAFKHGEASSDGNPAVDQWIDFFSALNRQNLPTSELIQLWGRAEETSTWTGIREARALGYGPLSRAESFVASAAIIYRQLMIRREGSRQAAGLIAFGPELLVCDFDVECASDRALDFAEGFASLFDPRQVGRVYNLASQIYGDGVP